MFHGRVGYGKTMATIYARNKLRAPMVTIGSTWTAKKLCQMILSEMGEPDVRGTTDHLVDRVIRALGERADTALLIDEADRLVDRNMVEVVRDIHDKSNAAIVLIGEERLPEKLQPFERFHGRVLAWSQAQPCDEEDVAELARCYAPEITIEPALIASISARCKGSARYISGNMLAIRAFAENCGLKTVTAEQYAQEQIMSGEYRAADGGLPDAIPSPRPGDHRGCVEGDPSPWQKPVHDHAGNRSRHRCAGRAQSCAGLFRNAHRRGFLRQRPGGFELANAVVAALENAPPPYCVTQAVRQQQRNIWTALRGMKTARQVDLALTASVDTVIVTTGMAKLYADRLADCGYLAISGKGRERTYRLSPTRDTGPKAPMPLSARSPTISTCCAWSTAPRRSPRGGPHDPRCRQSPRLLGRGCPRRDHSLAQECDRTSQNRTAARLGYSASLISGMIANTYPGDRAGVFAKIRGALMGETVVCPVLGEIGGDQCLREQAMPFSTASALRPRLWRACRATGANACPHSKVRHE